ncbi:MAG: hypothetical protein H6579_10405 [Chitinophagales bacterium]|nr:hypothetical protein [Bacteroidota bacterium]MCB9257532.1 hypothetical protein [Chitinophagales bacterium]
MKKLLFVTLSSLVFLGCKDCVECKYSTFKGTISEKYCSSTKQDRIDFEAYMDSLASANGSSAICTKEKY